MKKFLPNLVYLLLNLPLGVLYFTILVAGFSLGIGLSITLIGLPILFAMIFITYLLGDFDRLITAKLLGLQIAKPEARPSNKETITAILASQLKSAEFWKQFGYLLLKMPLGIISFTVAITFVSVSLALIGTPIVLNNVPDAQFMLWNGYQITSIPEALLVSVAGLALGALSVLLVNGLSKLMGNINAWALGSAE